MTIPTIYSNTKQALPGEEITVIASIGNGEWRFPNALSSDIEIVSGTLDSNILTFKCLGTYDPLTINFLIIEDKIFNGSSWTDDINSGIYGEDVLADGWTTQSNQVNSILTGWNFDGRSQRIDQILSGVQSSITQSNLTTSGEDYTVELDYRAYTDIELKVGGHTFELSASNEDSPFPIYPIQHGTGLINFEVENATGVQWILADGSFNTSNSVSKNVVAGTSYLIVDDFVGVSVGSGSTNENYIGSLSDIPSGLSLIELETTLVTGDIIEIAHITDVICITNTDTIYGNVSSISNTSSVIDLSGCPNISGDIGNLEVTDTIILDGTLVSGTVAPSADATTWYLNNTLLSKTELEDSLVNISEYAALMNIEYGFFECYDNMPTISSYDSCWALELLRSKNWTINVHESCEYSSS